MRTTVTVALLVSAALLGILAPHAVAQAAPSTPSAPSAQHALPLPLPAAGGEPLVTEGVSIEGPLLNNLTLPTLR